MAADPSKISEYFERAMTGHRRSLGRLLSIIERGGAPADEITELAFPVAGNAHVVGITGAPGAGKSTLTGQLLRQLVEAGRRPAILAVDPSSPLTGGAILGDRVRMDDLVDADTPVDNTAFIRSMATRGHAGGLALAVPAGVRLFDAVGYDPVIIETVGVGQVEVDVAGAADTTVVVVTPGMGDAVQANKSGLLEVADVFVVNKADQPGASDTRRDLDLMLNLSHISGLQDDSGYRPPIVMSTATKGTGADEVWAEVEAHLVHLGTTQQRSTRRSARTRQEVMNRLDGLVANRADRLAESEAGRRILTQVQGGHISPPHAAAALEQLL